MKPEFNAIIVHFDEIGLKGANQHFFISKLIDQIQKKLGKTVKKGAKKLVIQLESGDDALSYFDDLKLIPGIAYFSPAIVGESNFETIKKNVLNVVDYYKPKTFKISTRRAYKNFEKTSQEINAEVGEIVLNEIKNIKVDIKNPELMVKVEIEKAHIAVLGEKIQGVGGLAVGSTGSMLALLSGGIDSPVASFMMMKRGCRVKFVHFYNQTIDKLGVESKIKELVSQLSNIQGESTLLMLPFDKLQREVIMKVPSELRMIVYRRLMFKISEILAKREKCKALVTGDSLAQVASQTMENMSVIYAATDMLKVSPLVGLNKIEIMNISKQIGTYDISNQPHDDCCSLLIAKHPETRAILEDIEKAEAELEVDDLINDAIQSIKKYKL